MNQLNTPVAFIIFNRPEVTERVFGVIAQERPRTLLVVADGPRTDEEADKCKRTRAVIDRVDWPCDVRTNFAEKNLGLRQRVGGGLTWVFSQVEEAIVLEDDCLPDPSFFPFCDELLARYRDDERVFLVTGTNPCAAHSPRDHGYHFSRYGSIWGWASWRRAWRHFDDEMRGWPEFKSRGLLRGVFDAPDEIEYWTTAFDRMFARPVASWAYQWFFARLSQSGLSAVSNVNLVSNIGFGAGATNTKSAAAIGNLATGALGELRHPPFVVPQHDVDARLFQTAFAPQMPRKTFVQKIKRSLVAATNA
jgi:hypothetical protein